MARRNTKKIISILKHQIDFWGACMGLIVCAPFFIFISLFIKLDSRGPVFFRDEKIGKNGKPFTVWKFRTMVPDAMSKGLKHTVSKDDPRITRMGKILRAWGVDELPQLLNVLRGEMSIVGPRPTFRYQVEAYNDFQKRRLEVKPGLTGWAQIHGRNAISWERRIELDVWYADNWSPLLDLKIIAKTPFVLLKREGVYGTGGVNDPFINKKAE